MKNLQFLLVLILMLLFGCTTDEDSLLTGDILNEEDEIVNVNKQEEKLLRRTIQRAKVFAFQPVGDKGGPDGVLNPGDFFSPTYRGFAKGFGILKRGGNYIKFTIYTNGLPKGAYTIWGIIWNKPGDCGDGCGEEDLFIATNSIIYLSGGTVKDGGVGIFRGQLKVGEHRNPGTQELFVGSDLDAALENSLGAEVHMIIRYHGPSSDDRDLFYAQTHEFNGNCGEGDGENEGQCFDAQAVVFPGQGY